MLVAAIGSLYLVKEQSKETLSRDEQLAHFNASLDNWDRQAREEISAMREAGQQELTMQRQRVDDLVAQLRDSESSVGQVDLSDTMSSVAATPPPSSPDRSVADPNGLFSLDRDSQSDSSAMPEDQENASELGESSQQKGPQLAVVTRAFRSPEGQLTRAVIRNSGNQAAMIDEVSFVPQQEVRVPAAVGERPETSSAGLLLIAFAATDNSSQHKGSHGAYRRLLSEPLKLEPGEEFEIDVEIQNREHAGWGLMGELTVVSGADTLTLEQATAVFRAAEEA